MSIQPACFGSSCQYRYDYRNFIGKGSFGKVHKATITERGNYVGPDVVAVKCFYVHEKGFVENAENYARLQERFEMMLKLKHDHLVDYHQISIIPTLCSADVELVMDYYPGGNLKVGDAISHALDLANGLAFLHENGITHGDLKPGNVLIDDSNAQRHTLPISDWDGLVTLQRCSVSSLDYEHFRSSERYMSPEMIHAIEPLENITTWPPMPDSATDVWSLGCVLHQLIRYITGDYREILQHPVSGKVLGETEAITDFAFSTAVMQGYVPVVCDAAPVPSELAVCIRKCLCNTSSQRISPRQVLDQVSQISVNHKP
ncbi:uncharacterized protein LOC129601524 [Paramacrobiotus metropolitanus]|uniref:uncharacterized protein LOC129601524 n=1 Tax=Paramacrobiotus metropolitanus TaxID=2943436 RepID=UPI002445C9BB|nr:uncharacterized protein LOC129601524 [Paramacrobiotus metropolitanus]